MYKQRVCTPNQPESSHKSLLEAVVPPKLHQLRLVLLLKILKKSQIKLLRCEFGNTKHDILVNSLDSYFGLQRIPVQDQNHTAPPNSATTL